MLYLNTEMGQWYDLLGETLSAQNKLSELHRDTNAYLTCILKQYTREMSLVDCCLGEEYLQARQANTLKAVADKSLLVTGLFPRVALRKRVSLGYLIQIGYSSYSQLAEVEHDHLYQQMADEFISLVELLYQMREGQGGQSIITKSQAECLWRDFDSQYAFELLKKNCF